MAMRRCAASMFVLGSVAYCYGMDRRIAAVLVKKGILINSPKCELRCAASAGASVNIEATAVADQVEEIGRRIAAMLAERGILINSPNQSR